MEYNVTFRQDKITCKCSSGVSHYISEGEGARGEMECWRRVSGESAGMAEALGLYEGERSEGGEGYLEEGNG